MCPFKPFKQVGFSLLELTVAMALTAIVGGVFAAVTIFQSQAGKRVRQNADVSDLRASMTGAVRTATGCSCHLSPLLNPDTVNADLLYFDSTADDPLLNLSSVRLGCALTDPVVVTAAQTTTNGLVVESIQFRSLTPTGNGNLWFGKWRVVLRDPASDLSQSFEIPQLVYVDAADPDRAMVSSCQGDSQSAFVTSCPAGWTMIGGSGKSGTYCIDSASRGPSPYMAAKQACGNQRPAGFGVGHLCTVGEWTGGCSTGYSISSGEWVADNDESRAALKGPSCAANPSWPFHSTSQRYRCCLK